MHPVRTACGRVLLGELFFMDVLDEAECSYCAKGRAAPGSRPLIRG